jgi:hypothetical protein
LRKEKNISTIEQGATPQPTQPMEINIGSTTFVVNGFFKQTGKPLSEKLYRLMEKDVETVATARYNDIIPKECLAVGELKRTAI